MAPDTTMARKSTTLLRLESRTRTTFWVGLAMAGLGAIALVWPRTAPLAIGAFAGWLLWLAGAVMLGASLLTLRGRSLVAGVISSLSAVVAGIFLLLRPDGGALAVTLLATAVFVVDGAFQLTLALDLRPVRVWRWVLASALSSAAVALLVASGGARGSIADFGALLGLALASTGLAFMNLARLGKAPLDGLTSP